MREKVVAKWLYKYHFSSINECILCETGWLNFLLICYNAKNSYMHHGGPQTQSQFEVVELD